MNNHWCESRQTIVWKFAKVSVLMFLFTLGCFGCNGNGNNKLTTPDKSANSYLSEPEAINIVKAYLVIVSQPQTVLQEKLITESCSKDTAETNPSCKPCSPGSPNYCIDRWKSVPVEILASCQFPPSETAEWSTEYNGQYKEWKVVSKDPYKTGTNYWTVDDKEATVLSGYCVYK